MKNDLTKIDCLRSLLLHDKNNLWKRGSRRISVGDALALHGIVLPEKCGTRFRRRATRSAVMSLARPFKAG